MVTRSKRGKVLSLDWTSGVLDLPAVHLIILLVLPCNIGENVQVADSIPKYLLLNKIN